MPLLVLVANLDALSTPALSGAVVQLESIFCSHAQNEPTLCDQISAMALLHQLAMRNSLSEETIGVACYNTVDDMHPRPPAHLAHLHPLALLMPDITFIL